jgi:hypothetical protein
MNSVTAADFVCVIFTLYVLSVFRNINFMVFKKIIFNLHILSISDYKAGSFKNTFKGNICCFISIVHIPLKNYLPKETTFRFLNMFVLDCNPDYNAGSFKITFKGNICCFISIVHTRLKNYLPKETTLRFLNMFVHDCNVHAVFWVAYW